MIRFFIGLIVVLVVIFLLFMIYEFEIIFQLLGLDKKNDVLKFLGIGISATPR